MSKKFFFSISILLFLIGCGPSGAELEEAKGACEKFIDSEMRSYETKILDSWTKNGSIVFDVGYKSLGSRSSSYSVRKCVYDKKQGRIFSPSPLNDSEWKK
jgi:hypothetical protein